MKKVIASPNAPKAVGPYSQAILAGNTLYVSGQLPVNPETGTVPETIEEQTAQSLKNTGAILAEAGFTFDDVVKSTVLLADMNDFAAFNAVYEKYFVSKPARSCVAAAALPKGALVEVEVIAIH